MRQYPRCLKLENKPESAIIVHNEAEEIKAGKEGYESHWNPEINAKRKGTDREVLRPAKEVAPEKVEEEKEDSKPVILKEIKKRTRKGK